MTDITADFRESLAQKAYRSLREQIVAGGFEPGQRISLRRVATSLGMSLAPVGEAFRELTRDGLLETEPGWGTRVRRLNVEALRNQHILRIAIECESARQCSINVSEIGLQELSALAKDLDSCIDNHGDPNVVRELDYRFHSRIAELSGVLALAEVLKANQLVRMLARGSEIAHKLVRPLKQHVQLYRAIASRDPDQAERLMRDHCERSMKLQLDHANLL